MSKQKTAKARKQTLADSLGKATKQRHSSKGCNPVTDTLDIWTGALVKKAATGRGSNGKISAHGIQKLRELILELAVRGKLVPQDPDDEPASVLLERIAEEKALLVGEKKIRKPKNLPKITDSETPFSLPVGWEYARLNELGDWGAGATPLRSKTEYYDGTIQWFKSGELTSDYISDSEEHVTEVALKECSLRLNKPGDVLIAMYGATIGKTSILTHSATTNQAICACTPFSGFANTFLLLLLKAYKKRFIGMGAGGAQPNISREKIIGTVIALPPKSEQHRIVAKVDELMALCDQLEQQQADSIAAHQTLVETLLGTLTRVEDEKAFSETWQRIADHFDTLFTTENSVDQLKQTILQLAVMGKLVPQDPGDEPASVLVEKIVEEKARLIKDGRIRKQKALSEITDEDKLFGLPEGWVWVRLGDVSTLKGGFAYKSTEFVESGTNQVIRMGNIRPDYLRLDENPAYISNELAEETTDYLIDVNDILITMTGTKGKRDYLYSLMISSNHLKNRRLYLNQRLCIVRGLLISTEYLNMAIKDNRLLDAIYAQSTGTANQANIGMGAINSWVVPLPPLAEQRRIVAKVDELTALCDVLKARIKETQTTQVHLSDIIVGQAVA